MVSTTALSEFGFDLALHSGGVAFWNFSTWIMKLDLAFQLLHHISHDPARRDESDLLLNLMSFLWIFVHPFFIYGMLQA